MTTRHQIDAFLASAGDSSLHDIAAHLGEAWLAPEKNVLLRQIVGRMEKSGLIVKRSYGVYGARSDRETRFIDNAEGYRKRIAAFLRERGGHASTDEIQRAIGLREINGLRITAARVGVEKALATGFQQALGRGVWHLPREEIDTLLITGYWAERWMRRDRTTGWEDFFIRVGAAFRAARDETELSLAEIAAAPDVSKALDRMLIRSPRVRLACHREIAEETERRLAREGVTERFRIDQAAFARRGEVPARTLLLFEDGEPALHRAAPIEFYRSMALLYGVDAVGLSRGVVTKSDAECLHSNAEY